MIIKSIKLSKQLQQLLSPEVVCALWITETSLEERPFPFNELDYYVDGLLTKHIVSSTPLSNERKLDDQMCLIATQAFSHPFFIVHICLKSDPLEKIINDIKHIIDKNCTEEINRIVVIQNKPDKMSDLITKCFSNHSVFFLDPSTLS